MGGIKSKEILILLGTNFKHLIAMDEITSKMILAHFRVNFLGQQHCITGCSAYWNRNPCASTI